MTDKHLDRVLEVIDGGLQQTSYRPPVKQDCVRDGCHGQPEDGHAFCPPCLAWVSCETDDGDEWGWADYFAGII